MVHQSKSKIHDNCLAKINMVCLFKFKIIQRQRRLIIFVAFYVMRLYLAIALFEAVTQRP